MIQALKGTKDVLPQDSYKWQYIEWHMREICERYGLREGRTPVFEHTELFLRGVGDTTDIVQKEMYTFDDKGGNSITLKPEGTAGIVRMFIENGLYNGPQPTKMYYVYCPVFRYENTQTGRLREHHQFGVEIFGAQRASADAECIMLALELFEKVGVRDLALRINSIGCPACRPNYHATLRAYLKDQYNSLCDMCKTRFEKNPLRVLDCKESHCRDIVKNAPVILDYLCGGCGAHMDELKRCLDMMRVKYDIDPFIVRGLDYYTKTVFEIISTHIGAQGTVCGGGRYDGLIETVGGPGMPGVGFGLGMERLLLTAQNQGVRIPEPPAFDLFVASVGEEAHVRAFWLAMQLREAGYRVECDHTERSVKAQMKYANKLRALHVAVIGEDELRAGVVNVKTMETGEEKETSLNAPAMAAAIKRG
ncbi:MAG: histidine--tRNA ligase [Clostridiales bacterium]|jgi:histidyl-tRNA synthetase|nr:histidine--tRNA ligase [Clostridiales bacterium]